ncbi:DUF552 domain-containing protein [Candidatus Woesearchaeota archaeon]|nr:DUF552 domain-containing protein [Candidatus Woesearchaeota archaeon]
MDSFFSRMKKKMQSSEIEEIPDAEEGYVELDTEAVESIKSKIIVRPYTITDFEDVKDILDALREGYTIALINIKPLKDKDLVELKRAINKLKKTTDAIEGEIAGFGEDYIVVTPSFASIHRSPAEKKESSQERPEKLAAEPGQEGKGNF